MKIARFRLGAEIKIGIATGDTIIPLSRIIDAPITSIRQLLVDTDLMELVKAGSFDASKGIPISDVQLLAPIPDPSKFLGIGFNYQSHVDEVRKKGLPIPDLSNQVWFNKQTSSMIGPYEPMHLPSVSDQFDYECELVVVIGKYCRHVSVDDARKVIAGYMITNDASVRDWQLKAPTAILGKGFDTHGPTGPWITTADEIPDPHDLAISTQIDGIVMQSGNTGEMVNNIFEQIADLTQVMTLEPGDLLATGTPSGVGAGRTPPRWLKAGERVRIEIESLGHIENEVIPEPLPETTFIR